MKTIVDKNVDFDLQSVDGNAFALMGGFRRAALNQGWTKAEVGAVLAEARQGDYDHLITTLLNHTS